MIFQENNNTKIQLKEWYKQASGQHFKKIIAKELDSIKDIYQGNIHSSVDHQSSKKSFKKIKVGHSLA